MFVSAQNNALDEKQIEQLTSNIAKHLANFLAQQFYEDGLRVFSDVAIQAFAAGFVQQHIRLFYKFHPKEGQRANLPRIWLQHRHTAWVVHGIMLVKQGGNIARYASSKYLNRLVQRYLSR